MEQLQTVVKPFIDAQKDMDRQLTSIRLELKRLNQQHNDVAYFSIRDLVLVFVVTLLHIIVVKMFPA